MGYPMKKDIKIRLIFLYYEIVCELHLNSDGDPRSCPVIPGLSTSFIEDRATDLMAWLRYVLQESNRYPY